MFGMLKLPFPLNGEQRLGKLIAISNLAVLHLFRYQIFQDLLSFPFPLNSFAFNVIELKVVKTRKFNIRKHECVIL